MKKVKKILVGNTFPLSLVRGSGVVRMSCCRVEELREQVQSHAVVSYWGHENTRAVAEGLLGVSLKPATPRPSLSLSAAGRPMLDGETFSVCWVLSPDYRDGMRPQIGVEVGPERIAGWQVVKIVFP